MRITVINGTANHGCTHAMKELLIDAVGRDNDITEFTLPDDCPEFCTGCKACFYKDISVCPHARYTVPIWNAISRADLLVFTSPVYVFHVAGQMKALLDHFATKWMAHSPERQMFSKRAVIITNAIGSGLKNVVKDISDSLNYWGVARTYVVSQTLFVPSWSDVSPSRKDTIRKQCERVARIVAAPGEPTPSAGVKARFYLMRFAQKLIHKSWTKGGNPETRDHIHWRENGWLGSGRPWA